MHYKIKELHRLITILKSEEGLSDYGVTLLEGYAVGLETAVKNCSIPAVVGRSEQLFCPYCGHKKEFKIYTDVNSGIVCKNQLCRAK